MISSVERILPRAVDRFKELVNNLPEALQNDLDALRTQVKELLGNEIIMKPISDGSWKATYRGSFRGLLRLGGTSMVKISDESLKPSFFYRL